MLVGVDKCPRGMAGLKRMWSAVAAACCVIAAPAPAVQAAETAAPKQPVHTLLDFTHCGETTRWPSNSLYKGQRGQVDVAFLVGDDGGVVDIFLTKSSGFAALDDATVDSVRACTWNPALEDGKPVPTWGAVEFDWINAGDTDPTVALAAQKALSGAYVGDSQQQLNLGDMYTSGIGVEKDGAMALKLYLAAAEHGNLDAQLKMAQLYGHGELVRRDDVQMAAWYAKAAALGSAHAQTSLGQLLLSGRGIAPDKAKALHWLTLAADHAYAPAQSALGAMYMTGDGVPRDYYNGGSWYLRAAAQGDADAEYGLGVIFEQGQGVKPNLGTAVKWYQMAALAGHIAATSKVASLLEQGRGLDKNTKNALTMYQRAANGGDRAAMQRLIAMYEQGGLGVSADPALAASWRTRMARIPVGLDLEHL